MKIIIYFYLVVIVYFNLLSDLAHNIYIIVLKELISRKKLIHLTILVLL